MFVVHSPTCVPVFATPVDVSTPSPLSPTISRSLPKFLFIALVMPSSRLILWCPLLLLSFPESGTFPMSHLFPSDDQNTGASASASVLPGNIQVWSPLSLTSLTSLLSKGLYGVFSSTSVWRYLFFGVLPSLWPSSYNHLWPQVIYLLFWFCFISISCYKQVWFILFLGSLSAFSLAAHRSPFFILGDHTVQEWGVWGCTDTSVFCVWMSSCFKLLKVKVLVTPSCLTLCDPMDCSPPGSSVHGILQARILGGLPFYFQGDLSDPGMESASLAGRLYQLSCLGSPLNFWNSGLICCQW